MKRFFLLFLFPFILIGCASKEEVKTLQDAMVDMQKDLRALKKENTNLKEMLENLSIRVDELSEKTAENSLEIERIKKQLKLGR